MIHIATVHWNDFRWIDIQLRHLKHHLDQQFQIYAFLNGIPAEHRTKFFYSSVEPVVSHSIKLNLLADMAAQNSHDSDDLLIFLDGDAFPIGDILSYAREKLQRYPLIALQRRENNGDLQPHPAFCLTTIGFWQEIEGDWKAGSCWKDAQGRDVTDVGGNLMGILHRKGIEWHAMLRSNKRDLHPLFYGVYSDLIYHHGAGFRDPYSRSDSPLKGIAGKLRLARAVARRLPDIGWFKVARQWSDPHRGIKLQNARQSEEVFQTLEADPLFYRYYLEAPKSRD